MPLIIPIKVVPNAGKVGCVLDKTGGLKCYVKSPAEKGKANQELIKMLAKALELAVDKVHIVGGLASRSKRIKIDRDIDFASLLAQLGIEKQTSLF